MIRNSAFIAVFLLFITTFYGCRETHFEGYSVTSTGLEYQLHTLGEETVIRDGDMVVPLFIITDLNGKELASSSKAPKAFAFVYHAVRDTGIMEAVSLLKLKDSASFVLKSSRIKELARGLNDQFVVLHIQIIESKDAARYAFEQRFPEVLVDYEMQEQEQLVAFLDTIPWDKVKKYNGIYFIQKTEGEGDFARFNDEVVLSYEGFFLDGEKFDSTKDRKEVFTYRIGEQGQVLKGFDIGVRHMREGGEAIFIIPSQLAFQEGSGNAIVPPYTSVIYHVEFLKKET